MAAGTRIESQPDRVDVTFHSQGDALAGWYHPPPCPGSAAIVMAHGFSAVKEQYLDEYASAFAAAGFAVLVFDHACFGASGGLPRQEVDPERQRRGYRDAITWIKNQPGVDPGRIGIWGTSYSGGCALAVAAVDRRVGAVVAQVPTISGSAVAARRLDDARAASLSAMLRQDRLARVRGRPSGLVPVVGADAGSLCALPGPDAYALFTGTAARAPTWRNEVTLRSLELAQENEPGARVEAITAPVLIIVATGDSLTPEDLAEAAFERIVAPKRLVRLEGGHFSPYVADFEKSAGEAVRWFGQVLNGAAYGRGS